MIHTYHVHIYREMRLTFSPILAGSTQEAAELARRLPTKDAASIEDCDGADLAALVDLAGDAKYEHSELIDFEEEIRRKAAGAMLAALKAFLEADEQAKTRHEWKWGNLNHAFRLARDAVALANGFLVAPDHQADPLESAARP
jgi:hypothetical protein